VLTEAVPPSGGTGLVHHLLERFAEPGGRVIISSFGSSRRREPAEAVAERLVADGFEVPGSAQAIVSGIIVTQTAWIAAMVLYVGPAPLVPALNSYWLKIHVIAAILGSSLFALGGVMTILYLIKDRAEVWRVLPPIMGGSVEMDAAPPHFASGADEAVPSSPRSRRGILPTASTLDRIAYQTIAFAFPVWTFAVIAGAIWAEEAWGRYWGWDPKEVWSFVTWTIFAGYLHARATAGWKGRKAAVIALIRFVSLLITYYAVNLWIVGLHSYKGF
jgi:cytochrome c-type biogenesis protein CcsB